MGVGVDFLGECVWAIYTEKYREEYGTATTARKYLIRREIAAVLEPFPDLFDAGKLSPESRGPIYMAIRNRENRRR